MDQSCKRIRTAFVEFEDELTQQLKSASDARFDLAEQVNSLEKRVGGLEKDVRVQLEDHFGQIEVNATTIAAIQDRVSRLEHENQTLKEPLARCALLHILC